MSTLLNRFDSKAVNPSRKVLPVVLCIDISDSMNSVVDMTGAKKVGEGVNEAGQKINIVQGGISRFQKMREAVTQLYDTLRENTQADIEIAIVTFNETVTVVEEFTNFKASKGVSLLPKGGQGQTHLGEAVITALNLIDQAIQRYIDDERTKYMPWLLLFTDGEDRGSSDLMEEAISRANQLENHKKLMTYCFGINDKDLNLETLKRLNNGYTIHPFEATKLLEIFKMITYTMQQTGEGTVSNPKYQLDENMKRLINEGKI